MASCASTLDEIRWNLELRVQAQVQKPRSQMKLLGHISLLYISHLCNAPLPQVNMSQFSFVTGRLRFWFPGSTEHL